MKLSELRKLLEQATPGPWGHVRGDVVADSLDDENFMFHVARVFSQENLEMITALRNHADALLDVVEAAIEYVDHDDQWKATRYEDPFWNALAKLESV